MADPNVPLNPWHPMSDPVDLKIIGKLMEELGELQAALSRCLIQGINECEPVTKVPNKEWLWKEVADVRAGIIILQNRFDLPHKEIMDRQEVKRARLLEWHLMA